MIRIIPKGTKDYEVIGGLILLVGIIGVSFILLTQERKLCSGKMGDSLSTSRIYLNGGGIYILKDDVKKEYYRVPRITSHVTEKQFCNIKFYDSAEAAEKDGYKPSEQSAKSFDLEKRWSDALKKYPLPSNRHDLKQLIKIN